jgi:hypothetical protein
MPRYTWVGERLARLLELGDGHKRTRKRAGGTWVDIGAEFGITGPGAFKAYQKHARKRELGLGTRDHLPIAPAPDDRDRRGCYTPSDILARIERQGLTAGFLGDPPPGRSALDRKRAGLP